MTIPPILQAHLSILPLVVSCFFVWTVVSKVLKLRVFSTWLGEKTRRRLRLPLSLFLLLGIFHVILSELADIHSFTLPQWVSDVHRLLNLAIISWTAILLLKLFIEKMMNRRRSNREWQTNLKGLEQFAKAAIIFIAALQMLEVFGYTASHLLAIGGMAGIAVGLAARDLLANLFGALFLYMDKPFVVGDWIKSPDRDIEGTVEHIGLRHTRVRTFDSRPLYIPNSIFSNIMVQNPTRMNNRRIHERFGLRYRDADQLADVLASIDGWLRASPDVDQSQIIMVHFDRFGDSALECFVYAFTTTRDWATFHQVKQKVLLHVLKVIEEYGASCAFPTQTLEVEDKPIADTHNRTEEQAVAAARLLKAPLQPKK